MNTVSKKVKFENYELTITVADAECGMYRTLLIEQAQAEERKLDADKLEKGETIGDIKSLSRHLLHTILYPSMIAAVAEQKGFETWPVSFDEFRKLPEKFVIEWEAAVFELNKHWQPKLPEEEKETQKKATNSTQK